MVDYNIFQIWRNGQEELEGGEMQCVPVLSSTQTPYRLRRKLREEGPDTKYRKQVRHQHLIYTRISHYPNKATIRIDNAK